MSPEDILAHPPLVLSQEQRRFYFEQGYLLLESIIDPCWVERCVRRPQSWSSAAVGSANPTNIGVWSTTTAPTRHD